MSLFVMESVSYFGKKTIQVGKCVMAFSTEFLESQYIIFLKTLRIFSYNRFHSFYLYFNWA